MNEIKTLIKTLNKDGYSLKLANEILKEKKIRTDIFALDYLLSGGIAECEGGHRIEIFGPESSGKTTLTLKIIKKYQEMGKVCAFIDSEASYDQDWGAIHGVDNEKLIVVYPESLEEVGDLFVKLIPEVDLIVIDSITGLIPMGEAERDTAEVQMALSARVNSLICRKIYHAIQGQTTTLIFLNQMREKVGVLYGNPETTAGGRALKHLYSTRIQLRPGKPIDVNKERIGIEVNLTCVKNKKGKPYRKTAYDFYFNGLIDNNKSLLFAGVKYGVIERAGAYFSFGDIKEQGQEKFVAKLTDETWKEIEEEIWKRIP